MLSVYSTAAAAWATGHSLRESYPSAQMLSVYSTASVDLTTWHSLKESYSSAEIQSVYSSGRVKRLKHCEYCNKSRNSNVQYKIIKFQMIFSWKVLRLLISSVVDDGITWIIWIENSKQYTLKIENAEQNNLKNERVETGVDVWNGPVWNPLKEMEFTYSEKRNKNQYYYINKRKWSKGKLRKKTTMACV